jgi:hypothetical protein
VKGGARRCLEALLAQLVPASDSLRGQAVPQRDVTDAIILVAHMKLHTHSKHKAMPHES